MLRIMASKLKDTIACQLRFPTKSIFGRVVSIFFETKNAILEKNAVRLCNIEPHHKVLEVGFGPGIGLHHAVQHVTDGPGKICGVDISSYMVEKASAKLRDSILRRKVELIIGSVVDLPYATDYFDRVFHCNCFYFWPSMQDALQELNRVMKPGSIMVTTMSIKVVQDAQSKGLMKYGNPDPLMYMCALELAGFKDVRIEYFEEGRQTYEAIFCSSGKSEVDILAEAEQADELSPGEDESFHK